MYPSLARMAMYPDHLYTVQTRSIYFKLYICYTKVAHEVCHCTYINTSWMCHHFCEQELQLSGVGMGWSYVARSGVYQGLNSWVLPSAPGSEWFLRRI